MDELKQRGRYKFIPFSEYSATLPLENREGVIEDVKICTYAYSQSKARVNLERTEVVLSCTSGHGNSCDCLTHKDALERINTTWQQAEV